MKYDVFISYTSGDRAWAKKLLADLVQLGIDEDKIFFDRDRIDIGDDWREDLRIALKESRCLILLWSQNAEKSKWVTKEANTFDTWRAEVPDTRYFLQLNLQGRLETNTNLQGIDLLTDHPKFDFAAGPSRVDPWLWHSAISRLAQKIVRDEDRRGLNLVVLAATKREIEDLSDGKDVPPLGLPPLKDLWTSVDPTFNVTDLKNYYGEERVDWRPFRGTASVVSLLAEMRADILDRGGRPFLWELVPESIWQVDTNSSKFAKFKALLETEPAVIIIDGISLYHKAVWQRYRDLTECIKNPNAAIMVVSPVSFTPRAMLRDALKRAIQEYHEQYYNLRFGLNRAPAQCDLLIPDDFEMKRVLANTLSGARSHWATSQA